MSCDSTVLEPESYLFLWELRESSGTTAVDSADSATGTYVSAAGM